MARRKRRSGGFLSTLILIVSLGIFCYAGYQLLQIYLDYKVGTDEYSALEDYAVVEKKESEGFVEEEMAENETMDDSWGDAVLNGDPLGRRFETMENPIDFDGLLSINSDIVGWLEMEAVDISYPMVQGPDNDYYLHRTFQGTDNFAGSIFLDCENYSTFSQRNTIIYGHNMKNGSMFGTLKKYSDQETYEKSPYFWIYTPDRIYKYEIFSCAEVDKLSDDYQIRFSSEEEFNEFVRRAKYQSLVSNNVEVDYRDTVVTLSTCTANDDTRFIVQGKRIRTYEAVPKTGGYDQPETEMEG